MIPGNVRLVDAAERRVRIFIRNDVLALLELEAAPAEARLGSAPRGHVHRLAGFLKRLADAFERSPAYDDDVETRLAVAELGMGGDACKRCALEPRARVEQACRDDAARAR